MDNNNPNTSQSIDPDNQSQASSASRSKLSGSLLDRIKAQRTLEQQGGSAKGQGGGGQVIVGPDPTPSQITIPNYGPASNNNNHPPVHASNDFSELGSSSMMTASGFGSGAFGSGAAAMSASPPQGIMSGDVHGGGGMSEALLGNSQQQQYRDDNYSMSNYFQTFVMDMYSLFRTLPVWAQVILVIFLLFLVVKWI